jgi:hypothetical protein
MENLLGMYNKETTFIKDIDLDLHGDDVEGEVEKLSAYVIPVNCTQLHPWEGTIYVYG